MTGTDVEHALEAALNALGAHTAKSSDLDHLHKIDFVVTHFEGIPRFRPVGIQVTTLRDSQAKRNEFAAKQRGSVPLAIYLELDGVEGAVSPAIAAIVYAAILVHANTKDAKSIIGLRVSLDDGIEWFPVGVVRAARGAALRGVIQRIHAKGYGFLLSEAGETFFYHATGIQDAVLKDTIDQLQKIGDPWSEVGIDVDFVCNGFEREGAQYQSARDVVRRAGQPATVRELIASSVVSS